MNRRLIKTIVILMIEYVSFIWFIWFTKSSLAKLNNNKKIERQVIIRFFKSVIRNFIKLKAVIEIIEIYQEK